MKNILFLLLFISFGVKAQTHSLTAVISGETRVKLKKPGTLTLSDSIVVFDIIGQKSSFKVISKSDQYNYLLTDGTKNHSLKILPQPLKKEAGINRDAYIYLEWDKDKAMYYGLLSK